MISKDFFIEVFHTIKSQKLRSLLTAFGVFWGLLMLMFLIGAGIGFKEGLIGKLQNIPANTVLYMTDKTSMPYGGFDAGRSWVITDADIQQIRITYPEVRFNTVGIKYVPSTDSVQSVIYGDVKDEVDVAGVASGYYNIAPQRMVVGRYINDFDMLEKRKVCVIGENIAKTLFSGIANPVGRNITIGGTSFEVIGVTKKTNNMVNFGPNESQSIFLPLSTAQHMYNCEGKIDRALLVLDDQFPSDEYYDKFDKILRQQHSISPKDDIALMSFDMKSQLNSFDIMISGLNALVWLVGLGTLIAGLIGISNIMLVTVKERTQEIGIRRALGAMPETIIMQIMCESLVLTLSAGIVGIIVGVWGMYSINTMLGTDDGGFFSNPHVPFVPAVCALLILVVGGLVAGFVPAKRAMGIKAIEALHAE